MKRFVWYFLVIFTTILLLIAFMYKSVLATFIAATLCAILKKTGKNIDIPNIYKKLGVSNKFLNK